jgi:hypothetical protein
MDRNLVVTNKASIVVLKPTFARHFSLLAHMVIVHGSVYYLLYRILGMELFTTSVVWVLAFFFTVDILPTLILHLQYVLLSNRQRITVDTVGNTIMVVSKNTNDSWRFNEIRSLTYYSSYGAGANWYSFAYHSYCKLQFVAGEELIITNLVISDIKKNLPNMLETDAEFKYKIIAFIP